MDTKNLAELYDLEPIPWSRALEALESTQDRSSGVPRDDTPDGRPHLPGSARCGTTARSTS